MSETATENDGADTRDEIVIRDYERRQLLEFLPQVIDLYEERELDDERNLIDRFEMMLDGFELAIDGTDAAYEFGAQNWRDLSMALNELSDMRASWLATKIARRAELSAIQMGFTTTIPFMSTVTGETPVRPD